MTRLALAQLKQKPELMFSTLKPNMLARIFKEVNGPKEAVSSMEWGSFFYGKNTSVMNTRMPCMSTIEQSGANTQ